MLDIFEDLLQGNASVARERRPRIEHAQIMRRTDLQRAGRLGGGLLLRRQRIQRDRARLIYYVRPLQ